LHPDTDFRMISRRLIDSRGLDRRRACSGSRLAFRRCTKRVVYRTRVAEPAFEGESAMPVVFFEAPPGVGPAAKKQMVEKITAAIDEAYHIGDTLIFLREYPAENVALDGRLQSENPKLLEALKKISSGTGSG